MAVDSVTSEHGATAKPAAAAERRLEEAATAERRTATDLRAAEHLIVAEHAAAAERRSLVRQAHQFVGAAVRVVVSVAGVGIVLLVLSQIAMDTFYPTIDIKPVSVPDALDKAGYKADVVSRKLADDSTASKMPPIPATAGARSTSTGRRST